MLLRHMHVTLRFVGGVQLRDVRWGRRRPVRHVLLPSAESQPPSWHLLRPAATSAADASRAAATAVPAAPAALASGATTPAALVALTTLTAVTTTVTSAATPAALVALTTAVTTTVTPARAPVSSLSPLKRRCRGRSASAGCA